MVEKTDRSGGKSGPRSADGRRFEVFLRDEESDPVRHVGTVAAPTPDAAHEEASKLFGWYARDIWICPASELHRYSADSLAGGEESDAVDGDSSDVDGDSSDVNADSSDVNGESTADSEPRVYEETEGTPTVGCGRAPIDEEAERATAETGGSDDGGNGGDER